MKSLSAIIAAASMVFLPLIAQADSFVATTSGATPMRPIPANLCAGPWCSTAYEYINAYNSYANTLNQVNRMALQAQTYPQQANTNFSSDMQNIANIVSQTQSVNYQVGGIEKQVSQIWPNYSPGTPLASLNSTLNTQTASAIIMLLKGEGLISQQSTEANTTNEIAAIRSAAANAVNPTQATQVEVQMLTLIWEQLVKEQRLLELRTAEEAQHDLATASTNQQQLQYDQSLVQSLQTATDASPSRFSDAQIQAITSPAIRTGP